MEEVYRVLEILASKDEHSDEALRKLFEGGAFSQGISTLSASFRQPIFAIINQASSLYPVLEGAELYDELPKLNRQVRGCYAMLRTLANLSEFVRYSDGSYSPAVFDICTTVKALCGACNALTRSLRRSIIVHTPTAPLPVCVDPERLQSALLNVLANAIEYTCEEGEITVTCAQAGDSVTVRVADDGCGMPPEVLKKAATPFYSYAPHCSRSQRMGLGLAIAERFARAANGSLLLTSAEGEGATVLLRLPRAQGESAPLALQADCATLLSDRFSPVYLALADISDYKFF